MIYTITSKKIKNVSIKNLNYLNLTNLELINVLLETGIMAFFVKLYQGEILECSTFLTKCTLCAGVLP